MIQITTIKTVVKWQMAALTVLLIGSVVQTASAANDAVHAEGKNANAPVSKPSSEVDSEATAELSSEVVSDEKTSAPADASAVPVNESGNSSIEEDAEVETVDAAASSPDVDRPIEPRANVRLQTDTESSSKENIVATPERDLFTGRMLPGTDRIVNVFTTATARKGSLVLTVDHRAHKTFISGEDAFFDYLGLDSGNLKIGFGLRYGIMDFLDAGFYRLSNGTDLFDVYEFDGRVRFLSQEKQYINASVRGGGTWFVQKDADDASGFFAQLGLDRRFFGVLLLGTGVAFHTNSTSDKKTVDDEDVSAAISGYLEWRPITRFSLNAEIAGNIAGYGGRYPIFAFSARILTHRHAFSLVVGNSQYMSADGIVSNTWRKFSDVVFGFQIVRQFDIVK